MERRLRAHAIALALLVVGCDPSESEQQASRIRSELPPALQRAHHLADQYRFEVAYEVLHAIEDEITASGLELAEEREAIRDAFREIAQAKSEHYRLTQLGHVVFEGRLIPGEERDRILAEREAAKRRRLDEQERIAKESERERLRRIEEKRLAEERARQAREAERARAEAERQRREEAAIEANRQHVLEYVAKWHNSGYFNPYGIWFWEPPRLVGQWSPKVGRLGYLSSRIVQVLPDGSMLVDIGGVAAFVNGVPTSRRADGQVANDLPLMQVVGTKQYTTVKGETRTALVLEVFDIESLADLFPARSLSVEDRARAQNRP